MAFRMQEFIHQVELGSGRRYLKYAAAIISVISMVVVYDLVAFRNLGTQEAMDTAQLARNLADGKGYTTHFIRPFSLYLVNRSRRGEASAAERGRVATNGAPAVAEQNSARLDQPHPDLANPPVYPLLLAGLLKVMPFAYPDLAKKPSFSIYLPDLWITLFNQLLFLVAVGMVFRLGATLFDEGVGWVSAVVFLGADLFWRFSVSGLSTLLLILILLGLVGLLMRVEAAAREGSRSPGWLMSRAAACGAWVGVGCLTRYGFGWLMVPVLVLLGFAPGAKRMGLMMSAVLGFAVVLTPWVVRNAQWSGAPFGVAGYAVYQDTPQFPENELERSLNPDLSQTGTSLLVSKLFNNGREIFQNDLPRMGGSWVSALFLAGLLVPFRSVGLGRLRLFLILALGVLAVAQALGRTQLTADSPEINSENLLVILAPLVFIFGAGFFFILLDQLQVSFEGVRHFVIGIFCLLAATPFLFTFVAAHPSPIVFPPYYPPWIQQKARLLEPGELVMSDIPWAVAWYGGQPRSVWLSLRYKDKPGEIRRNDFLAVNDILQPVNALYLSSKTLKGLDPRALWAVNSEEEGGDWGSFILGVFAKREVPTGFPLKRAPEGLLPEIFLTDSERNGAK